MIQNCLPSATNIGTRKVPSRAHSWRSCSTSARDSHSAIRGTGKGIDLGVSFAKFEIEEASERWPLIPEPTRRM